MKRSLPVIIIAVVVLAVGGYLFAQSHKAVAPAATNPPATSNTTNQSNSSASTATAIAIQNFAFAPASTTVKVGTTVTWTNQDSASHNVVETDGQAGPQSSTLANGQSYSFTFAKAGTYHYHCSFHPSMTGTVTVTP